MSMKLFAGFVGREEGWRRELRGRPASGGANGGRRWPFSAKGRAGLGSRAQERRREVGDISEHRGKTLGGQGREKERGAVGRVVTTSPWQFGGHPRLACRDRRRVAGSRSFREEPGRSGLGARRGRGSWPGKRRAAGGSARPGRNMGG